MIFVDAVAMRMTDTDTWKKMVVMIVVMMISLVVVSIDRNNSWCLSYVYLYQGYRSIADDTENGSFDIYI